MENVLRVRRNSNDGSVHRYGVLSDGEKEWELGFLEHLSEIECYRMAVGFARRVRNLAVTKTTSDGYHYKMPAYLQEMDLVTCCKELEDLELTFALKGCDA